MVQEWRTERTNWRDAKLSKRHGAWGFNCPAVDLDFVMLEYNYGIPCAIIEYKHIKAQVVNPTHANYKALAKLADGYKDGPLPCFIARYDPNNWSFQITPLNEKAAQYYKHCLNEKISEQRFVKSLHLLRKSALNESDIIAIKQLNTK
ncbi:MAG: hypothetical protein U9N73_08715 [Candidatus Auribacterota bacterium]|nr:hypothetical protein [Candidatus Auribacterota bacterium]MEA1969346.1 hypothetical protein [Thermodesulfobacteriota bacterium]